MAGIINLYVTKEGEVLRIPNSKYDKYELYARRIIEKSNLIAVL